MGARYRKKYLFKQNNHHTCAHRRTTQNSHITGKSEALSTEAETEEEISLALRHVAANYTYEELSRTT